MRPIAVCLLAFTACTAVLGRHAENNPPTETGTLLGNITRTEPGRANAFIPAVFVRLCSTSRVLQTLANKNGAFTFLNVPAGKYDVDAGGRGWAVYSTIGIEVHSGTVSSVAVDMSGNGKVSTACFPDAVKPCRPTEFEIEYGQLMVRKLALVSGEVRNWQSRGQKPLPKAHISIFKHGEADPLYSFSTGKDGRFGADLQPGIYGLVMSRTGFQDVKIPDFLVPLENETKVTIRTARIGAIVVCQ